MADVIPSVGAKILSATSSDALEDAVNTFLKGDSTVDNRRKIVTSVSSFFFNADDSKFYVLVFFQSI